MFRRDPRSTTTGLLKRVRYFGSLPAAELRRLVEQCVPRVLRPGEMLFEEGRPCSGLFIVADGAVEIRQTSVRGREQVFHAEGPGATLGEGPLFEESGIITRRRSRVVIRDATRLAALARGEPMTDPTHQDVT